MRIIGGRFGGRRLLVPRQGSRPTTDRTREAIFNLVTARVELRDRHVLDLFAGSGALGLEALSRGAAHATFIENRAEAVRIIQANAAELDVLDRVSIRRVDAFRFIERAGAQIFGLAFADPPYDLPQMERLPDLVLPLIESDLPGLFVLEHDVRHSFQDHPSLDTSRTYGGTVVSLFGSGREDGESVGSEERF